MSQFGPDLAPPDAPFHEVVHLLEKAGCTLSACGSRVTCNPPPQHTDEDYLVAVPDTSEAVAEVVNILSMTGFLWEGNEHYQNEARSGFMSWRRDRHNLIVIAHPDLIRRHRAATYLCARLNLLDKADRIALFQAVLYGNYVDDGEEPS